MVLLLCLVTRNILLLQSYIVYRGGSSRVLKGTASEIKINDKPKDPRFGPRPEQSLKSYKYVVYSNYQGAVEL